MRILHVTDVFLPHLGGIEVFVDDLARRQQAAGHEVTVLTSSPGSTSPGGPRVIAPRGSRLTPPPVGAGIKAALSGEYDVVHAHLSVLSPFTTLVAGATAHAGMPTVHTVHSLWNGREIWVRAAAAAGGWHRSPAVWTAVSPVAARDMNAVLGADTTIQVVPNAVDVDWWRHGPWLPEDDILTVVSVMRLAGRKRPLPFVRMLDRLRRSLPAEVGLRAIVIGDGPQQGRVADEVERRGLAEWVRLPGRLTREQIRDVFAAADVYVSPAYQESFGIAALEARAAGLPVLAMASGGISGFIADGVEGMLCADDDAMIRALGGLARDPARIAAMRTHNRLRPPALGWSEALAGFASAYAAASATPAARSPFAGAAGGSR
jgi:phosphatidylinositol alpha 1,6-mannosyltransferase